MYTAVDDVDPCLTRSGRTWDAFVVVGPVFSGMGSLSIGPTGVALSTAGLFRLVSNTQCLRKTEGEVQVLYVRLRLPWMRTVVQLGDYATASLGPFAARRVVKALQKSGLQVRERRVWLYTRPGALDGDLERVR
jgi:hypothetical protein